MKDRHGFRCTAPYPDEPGYEYLQRKGLTYDDLERGHNRTDKVGRTLEEFQQGTLRSSSGHKVTNKDQALAIGLSQKRRSESKG